MNIWGLQKQIKEIITAKKEYLERPRGEIKPSVINNFNRGISSRKMAIKELRKQRPKKKKSKGR